MDINTALASIEKNAKSSQHFIAELAARFKIVMPSLTEVVTQKSWFSKEEKIIELKINLENLVYRVELSRNGTILTFIDQIVRGIRIKSEELKFSEWNEKLSEDLKRQASDRLKEEIQLDLLLGV